MKFLTTGGDFLKEQPDFKLVGRDEELKALTSILMLSNAASVIIVGPGGVGSTALCMGLQAIKGEDNPPVDIVTKRIHWLQTDKIFALGDSGQIKEAFAGVMRNLLGVPSPILIIEDARDFIDGTRSTGTGSVINSINDAVKAGKLQVIVECRDEDIGLLLKTHSDFVQCYTILDLAEPEGDALKAIVTASLSRLKAHHGIEISEAAAQTAIMLTNKYRTRDASLSRAQPARTTNLIDRAMATYRLAEHKKVPSHLQERIKRLYEAQRNGEIAIVNMKEEIEELQDKAAVAPAPATGSEERKTFMSAAKKSGAESDEIKAVRAKIREYEDAVKTNRTEFDEVLAEINSGLILSEQMILTEFSRLSGIAADRLNEDEREKLRTLEGDINALLYGQEEVVTKVTNAIKIARIGRRNKTKPQAAFLMLGPSGVGKTEVNKILALLLLGDAGLLTRYDMSEYMEKHSVAKLIGAPPGYEGYEMGGILTNDMRKNPQRIVLFDEIEKAHPDVFNVFLQILSDGRLTDNHGRTVSFSESIVVLTSNIGQPELLDESLTREQRHAAALEVLLQTPGIRPEFLNRFAGRQNIIFFDALEPVHIEKIAKREFEDLNRSYLDSGITLNVSDECIKKFVGAHYDKATGARGIPGYIQTHLEPIVANLVLDTPDFKGEIEVQFDSEKDDFTVKY